MYTRHMANTDSVHRADKRDADHEWQVIDTETGECRGWWDNDTWAYLDNDNGEGVSVLWRRARRKK